MRLLFDENLAPRLVAAIADLYPGSVHVRDVGLARATDVEVWAYARTNGLAIVSKDADFQQRSFVDGHPPKVVWIRLGNCPADDIERLLRERHEEVTAFEADEGGSFLILS